jgi:Zn-dependent protease
MNEDKSKKSNSFYLWLTILPKLSKAVKGLLVLAKSAKLAGPLLTIFSMMLSMWAYSTGMGWTMAGLFVGLILIHELGHVIACKHKKLKTSAPLFIPFLGALIFVPPNMTREEESYVGFGGPLLGTIGALFVWGMWIVIPSHPMPLLMASYIGLFINLFNLIPMSPLDGGRILQSVGTWVRWVGLSLLIGLTALTRDPSMMYIWLIVLMDSKVRYKERYMAAICVIMSILLLMGYGERGAMMWIFIALSIFLCVVAYGRRSIPQEEVVERPAQPRQRARAWLGAYCVLAVIIFGSMYVQSFAIDKLQPPTQQEQVGSK